MLRCLQARENLARVLAAPHQHDPLDGIVVLTTMWKQGQMGEAKEGDQIRPGTPFMQVVDPSLMQVRVLANQQDFLSLRPGQSARSARARQ